MADPPPPGASPNRGPSVGVAQRVILGVAVVVIIVAAATSHFAFDRVRDMNMARVLQQEARISAAINGFRAAMFAEEVEWVLARNHEVHAEPGAVANPNIDLDAAQKRTDTALVAIPVDRRPVLDDELDRLRQTAEVGEISPNQIAERFGLLDLASAREANRSEEAARRTAIALGELEIANEVESIQLFSELFATAADTERSLLQLWYAVAVDVDLARTTLAADRNRFDALADDLSSRPDSPETADWRSIVESAPTFDTAVAQILAGAHQSFVLPKAQFPDVDVLSQGTRRAADLGGLIRAISERVVERSNERFETARRDAFVTTLTATGIVAAVAAASWSFARSIVRPLRSLTLASARVVAGDLAVEPLPLRGPAELVDACEAFNITLENLRLIEMKARAMARADLEAPIMRQPLPGRVGESMTRSVEVLSRSLHESEALEARLSFQATHDSLTGIANRAAAIQALGDALHRRSPRPGTVAAIFVDLDDFGAVNDSFGHGVGDVVLRCVAAHVLADVRGCAFVSRIGGDEFLVLAEGVDGVEVALDIASRVINAVKRPIEVPEGIITCEASAGVALNEPGDNSLALLRRADLAVYRAKRLHPGTVQVFDAAMKAEIAEREEIEDGLRSALADGDQFVLEFQPIVSALNGLAVGAEALIRWNHPRYGRIAPDKFIGVAEQSNLINDVDRWVLRHALGVLASWADDPVMATLTMSVNVSGRHLVNALFMDDLKNALAATGANPRRLMVEITETVLVMDLSLMNERLVEIRGLGIRVAVDDYGTGFTSLAHVRCLPIDELKIDQSFVRELRQGTDNVEFVRMICGLARLIDVEIVAEGVENEAAAQVLRSLGCNSLQGYLFARSMPNGEFREWIHERIEPHVYLDA